MKLLGWIALGALLASPMLLAPACSLENNEGPDVSCADLECGRINACQDGIIAQCKDGKSVVFHVCTSSGDDLCEEDWQLPGEYRCLETGTDCEGCRPERTEGCAYFTAASSGGSAGMSTGGSTSTTSTGGSGGTGGSSGSGGAGGSSGSGGAGG